MRTPEALLNLVMARTFCCKEDQIISDIRNHVSKALALLKKPFVNKSAKAFWRKKKDTISGAQYTKACEAIKLLYCAVADGDVYADDPDRPGYSVKDCSNIASRALAKFHDQFSDVYIASMEPK